MELPELLKLLRATGIRRFKDASYEIELEFNGFRDPAYVEPPVPKGPELPPDLRADDTMNEEKITFWSGGPSPESEPDELPLTGESPIEGIA